MRLYKKYLYLAFIILLTFMSNSINVSAKKISNNKNEKVNEDITDVKTNTDEDIINDELDSTITDNYTGEQVNILEVGSYGEGDFILETINYNNLKSYDVELPKDKPYAICPINITKESSVIEVSVTSNINEKIDIKFYKTKECKTKDEIQGEYLEAKSNIFEVKTYHSFIENPGVYYAKIFIEHDENTTFFISASSIQCKDRNMTSLNVGNNFSMLTSLNKKGNQYLKLDIENSGILALQVMDQASINYDNTVVLCDYNKKELGKPFESLSYKKRNEINIGNSTAEEMITYTRLYNLNKGTYYIKLKTANSSTNNAVLVSANLISINEKSGDTKETATAIKSNNKIEGTLSLDDKVDWYKINLKKNKKLKLNLQTLCTSGEIIIKVYDENKNKVKLINDKIIDEDEFQILYNIESKSKLEKGTYYIKILQTNKDITTWYSLINM